MAGFLEAFLGRGAGAGRTHNPNQFSQTTSSTNNSRRNAPPMYEIMEQVMQRFSQMQGRNQQQPWGQQRQGTQNMSSMGFNMTPEQVAQFRQRYQNNRVKPAGSKTGFPKY